MCSLSEFRLPQFSEDDAWLPAWLQQCNFERLNVEGIKKDYITFEQRVEELQFCQKVICSGESPREGGCNIGRLFLSGTDNSPLSFPQSSNNVVQFHLCLSSDGNTENTTIDVCQAESNCVIQPLENSAILDVNLSLCHNDSPVVELERPVNENDLLKHDENVKNSSEASADAVELCIAASEALVINELIDCDSFAKPSSMSAILEASLQVKQARLEVWKNNSGDSIHIISEMDNLSDLDDITMENAYEDVGIYHNLSVSQVKDTFDSEYSENLKNEKRGVSAVVCAKSCGDSYTQRGKSVTDNNTLLRKDFAAECCDGDSQKEEVYAPTADNNSHGTNVSSSPFVRCRDGEKDNTRPNIVQESFQSRWLGGWTSNTPQKEVQYFSNVRHSIPLAFACETSFLSESADAAPDENSFVQNHNRGPIIVPQLSLPSQNFCNAANDGMLLSQDVRSSSTSLVDPLCSVVPCSISENTCSSPVINHEDTVQEERIPMPIADMLERSDDSRQLTSLRNFSKLLPSHTNLFKNDSHQKSSLLIDCNTELAFQERTSTNHEENVKGGAEHSVLGKENPIRTAVPESKAESLPRENLQWGLLRCQTAQKLPASKRVHFSEKETDTQYKKIQKALVTLKTGCLTSAAKKATRSSGHLESKAQNMARCLKNHLDKEKKRLIFQNMEFLLTGFSQQKEKELEGVIRKYGGIVLSQIPATILKGKRSSRSKSRVLPIVLSMKKVQSFKFLYGCAVNAYLLKVNWLMDSIEAGVVLPPKRYMILPRKVSRGCDQVYTAVDYKTDSLVFNNLGIMLHGKTKHFTNIATIIKHGGGQVFKTLHRMVQALEAGRISIGVIVADEESCASRHLKHCALEQNIPMTSVYWIIKSLYSGELIPFEEKKTSQHLPAIRPQRHSKELSQEI